MSLSREEKQTKAESFFKSLRDQICKEFESIEMDYTGDRYANEKPGKFVYTPWERPDEANQHGGGGTMGLIKGRVFEKAGVNVSTVHGTFSEEFRARIPGADKDGSFWASGISLVAHMQSPLVPAVHMNFRQIMTTKEWFGGGADLTPMIENATDTKQFHDAMKKVCDAHDPAYYEKYKKDCDDYFFLHHRNEPRGVGGIFIDNHNSGDWDKDFAFIQDVGKAFLDIFPKLVREHMNKDWTKEQRHTQLVKRGRYVEFNLLYDRGTTFGLKTGGNTDAILMSMPPTVIWE